MRSGPDLSLLTIRGIIGRFYRRMEDVQGGSWAPRVGMMVPSNQEVEPYRLLGMSPQLREWRGGRLLETLRADAFEIRNRLFEATLPFSLDDLRRDKTGQMAVRIGDLAKRAGQHWELLVSDLIETNGLCYDGQNFFDTDHSLGDSGAQNNDLAAAQVPALNVGTPAAPTEDEMVDALIGVISYLYGYKDDKGQPVNGDAKEWGVMVSPNLMGSTIAAIRSNLRKQGSTSALPLQEFNVTPIVNPRFTTTTKFVVVRLDTEMKPFILQEEVAVQTEVLGPGSDEAFKNRRWLYGVTALRAAGYGEPLHAARATLS